MDDTCRSSQLFTTSCSINRLHFSIFAYVNRLNAFLTSNTADQRRSTTPGIRSASPGTRDKSYCKRSTSSIFSGLVAISVSSTCSSTAATNDSCSKTSFLRPNRLSSMRSTNLLSSDVQNALNTAPASSLNRISHNVFHARSSISGDSIDNEFEIR